MNPLYQQYGNKASVNPMLRRLMEFKKTINGNPQQMVQNMISSGRISQEKVNQLVQQTNELYEQFKGLI